MFPNYRLRAIRHRISLCSIALIIIGLSCFSSSCGFSGTPNASGAGNPSLQSIAITPTNAAIKVGTTQAFKATGTYSDGSTQDLTSSASWTSSNIAQATIQSSGQPNAGTATGVAQGSPTITATESGVSGTATLSVTGSGTKTLSSIAITPASAGIAINGTVQFTATGQYSDGSTQTITNSVTWTSSNTAIATINSAGRATGVSGGTVTISATKSNVTGTASLSVTSSNATITSISVDPVNPSVAVGQTQQFYANATYSDGSTQDITATASWTSSNSNAATIETAGQSQPGLATGAAAGTT